MTGPGAEEEIQEYGEHYCPTCGQVKYFGDALCGNCQKSRDDERETNP